MNLINPPPPHCVVLTPVPGGESGCSVIESILSPLFPVVTIPLSCRGVRGDPVSHSLAEGLGESPSFCFSLSAHPSVICHLSSVICTLYSVICTLSSISPLRQSWHLFSVRLRRLLYLRRYCILHCAVSVRISARRFCSVLARCSSSLA